MPRARAPAVRQETSQGGSSLLNSAKSGDKGPVGVITVRGTLTETTRPGQAP